MRTKGFLQRYPKTQIIWSANYRTTQGILKALSELKRIPGEDVILNSYDIDPTSLDWIEKGVVQVAAGGHYVEGAWSVVMGYDFLEGFRLPLNERTINTPMMLVKKGNLSLVKLALIELEESPRSLSKADFSRFSLVKHPNHKGYRFSLEKVLAEMVADSL